MTIPPDSSGSGVSSERPDSYQSTNFLNNSNLSSGESSTNGAARANTYPGLEPVPFKYHSSSTLPKLMPLPIFGSRLPSNWLQLSIIGAAVFIAVLVALWGVLWVISGGKQIADITTQINWDAVGALGEVFGAIGQILIAILALYVAWRQYVIERDLTLRQNLITQQQTIDSYFQGISELVLDGEGLLEDWPQERAIAEARTAAILSSVDADGKAKIIRFLSRAHLLTPLKRDQRLGRAILDGTGGYAEDRQQGVRVVDLGIMLAGTNLAATDLRWTDLSEANLIRADLSQADLVRCNLSRTILVDANLAGADLKGALLFYGRPEAATPRSQMEPPNYQTGAHTGAVIEGADLTAVEQLSPDQRYYCCAWGGTRTRLTIPGGCEGIPNKLD